MNIQDSALVLGLQSGNEGKTKVIQTLFPHAHAYVRFNGSTDIPHLVETPKGSVYLYHIPTGIVRKGAIAIISQGVFVHPSILRKEIELLRQHGVAITPASLKLSTVAPVIMPWDIALDSAEVEETSRGFRFASAAYIAREAIRVQDVFSENFENLFMQKGEVYNSILQSLGRKQIPLKAAWNAFMDDLQFLQPFVTNTHILINDLVASGEQIVFESSSGVMLDVYNGPYPSVLPSIYYQTLPYHTVGVFKPYTAVGSAGLPTMPILHKSADDIRSHGHEFDLLSDQPRKMGWLDIPMLKYALHTGVDELALMKLDALTGLDELYICTAYIDVYNNREVPYVPGDGLFDMQVTKQYESFPSWKESLTGVTEYMGLPRAARNIIEAIEGYLGQHIRYISTGPKASDYILR